MQKTKEYPTIKVYNAWNEEISYEYIPDMEPEIFPEPDNNGCVYGYFTVFYLSGYEEDDGSEYSECYYGNDYYAVVITE